MVDDYADLALEAVGHSWRMEIIKDRMKFKLRRGIVKLNIDLEEKMLKIEQQKAHLKRVKVWPG